MNIDTETDWDNGLFRVENAAISLLHRHDHRPFPLKARMVGATVRLCRKDKLITATFAQLRWGWVVHRRLEQFIKGGRR
jgi:hypothetical protein